MKNIGKTLLIALTALSISTASFAAGKKPKPSYPADPNEVIKIYSGNTWTWTKGGSYWGKDGKFEAVWEDILGLGKWYVTKNGTLCYVADWYEKDGSVTKDWKRCWEHVKDESGNYYQQPTDKKDRKKWGWGRVSKVSKGNGIKSDIRKLKKKNGL